MDDRTSRATSEGPLTPLLSDYRVPAGHFDELLDPARRTRASWMAFAEHAGDLRPAHLTHAQARVDRQIHENGVTYNVYAAADGPGRPWTLDILPLIVTGGEWDVLSSGLRQRARLLNAVAADLYGARRLLTERLVPAPLVFRHPGFLRACDGVVPPGGTFLHLVAFDVARGPDGVWRVLRTRTQAPSGAGYALENRATISRLFPDAFRMLHVQPLGAFFHALQDVLRSSAPCDEGDDTPLVVLLTPGPYNETYFEHAFLAKQLGFPLVEGGDLTVRQDRLFLKTVSGLRRVHGVLRRLDDDYCDPLELRSDSTLGVPGLVQAWRAGHVLVANAFGTSVLESPLVQPYLPRACERLLGETLETPSLVARWCGDPSADDLAPPVERSVLRAAFQSPNIAPVFLNDLEPETRKAWLARVREAADAFAMEEHLPLSHVPVWHGGRLESRALMLRVLLAWDGRGDYRVMPGGLARIAGEDQQIVSTQRGGSSKDTWILSETRAETPPVPETRAPRREAGAALHLTTSSRAAEHLFWLGRYAERSESGARLLRAVLSRLTDPDALPARLRPLVLRVCRQQGLIAPRDGEPPEESRESATAAIERALVEGLTDARTHHGLAFNIAQTVRVAGATRDRLSSDNWKLLNRLSQLMGGAPNSRLDLDEVLDVIDQSIVLLVAVAGLEMAHMTRNDGWRFLSIGRHLERLSSVGSTLKVIAESGLSADPALLEWLLDVSDSLITYRARYMHSPEWSPVVDLLLFDAHNPRSLAFQLAKLSKHVRQLPDADTEDLIDRIAAIDGLLARSTPRDPAQGELFDHVTSTDGLLASCAQLAGQLSDALTLRYFSHVYDLPQSTVSI